MNNKTHIILYCTHSHTCKHTYIINYNVSLFDISELHIDTAVSFLLHYGRGIPDNFRSRLGYIQSLAATTGWEGSTLRMQNSATFGLLVCEGMKTYEFLSDKCCNLLR